MLPRLLAIIFLLGSMILAGKLVYESVIFQFWTTQWVIGTLSTLILISVGVSLLFLSNKEQAYIILGLFGVVYSIAALLVYTSWGYQHIQDALNAPKFFGYFVLFIVVATVASIGLSIFAKKEKNEKIFLIPAWGSALSNVGLIFMVVWKYVFWNVSWQFFPFIGEIVIIITGASIFLYSYMIAEKINI